MKKKPVRKKITSKVSPACHCHNSNPSITSLFTEVFESNFQVDSEKYHEALSHSPAFQHILECAQGEDVAMCCLLSDAVLVGWKAGQKERDCQNLEKMVCYE